MFYYSCHSFLGMKEAAGSERLQSGHLTKLLEEELWADVSTLHVQKIISAVSELLERLKSCGEDGTAAKHTVTNCSLHTPCCRKWADQRQWVLPRFMWAVLKQAPAAKSLGIVFLYRCKHH